MIDQFLNIELDHKGNMTIICEHGTHRKTTLVILRTIKYHLNMKISTIIY